MMRHSACAQRIGLLVRFLFFCMVTEESNIRKREVYGNAFACEKKAACGQNGRDKERSTDRNSGEKCGICFQKVPLQKMQINCTI